MNANPKCNVCPLSSKCIYYYLSGENFKEFPSIIIERSVLESHTFQTNDLFVVRLIMLDDTFENYVIRFFEEFNRLETTYLILKSKEINHVDLSQYVNGTLYIKAPIDRKSLENQLNYYKNHYHIEIDTPKLLDWKYQKTLKYHKVISINDQWIHFDGQIGELSIQHINKLLLHTGIGSYGFLLGGQMDETKD